MHGHSTRLVSHAASAANWPESVDGWSAGVGYDASYGSRCEEIVDGPTLDFCDGCGSAFTVRVSALAERTAWHCPGALLARPSLPAPLAVVKPHPAHLNP